MTPDGFAWVSDIEMQVGNHLLDLHGEYLFRSVTYDIARRSVTLQWARRQEDHVDPDQPGRLMLIMNGVHHFEVRPRDPELPPTEDDCLGGLSYYCDEDWCTAPFWTETAPDEDWFWVFEFMSHMQIFVGAETAVATLR